MAIEKEICCDNGVLIKYHRVASLNIITNWSNVIEVCGYTSEEKRKEEKNSINANNVLNEDGSANKNSAIDVYMETNFIESPYDPSMNIIKAYEYIKTLPEYNGAEDVLEDGQVEEINQVLNV